MAQENLLERMGTWFAQKVASFIDPKRVNEMVVSRDYYIGDQQKQLKTKAGQYDDNIITNFIGLAVDRNTSLLFGGGVSFTVPEGGEHVKQLYLDEIWRANKQEISLHRLGLDGEIYGTAYVKIIPDGLEYNGKLLPRLIILDPALMAIQCNPMDLEEVWQYSFEIKVGNEAFREITRRAIEGEPDGWIIEKFKTGPGGAWQRDGEPVVWPYPFPPIIHIQNLPSLHNVYGTPGVKGLKEIQDKYNFANSNTLKIIRYHANPKTYFVGVLASMLGKAGSGPDEAIVISDKDAKVGNLEMQSDLASSRAIVQDLRQTIFDLSRVPDISSMKDKIGGLTNFGLRILYSDALAKNSTRRALYGEGLIEINRRLLMLNNMDGNNDIVWGNDLPADEKEDAALILQDLAAGIASRETVSEERGYTWKTTTTPEGVVIEGEEDKIKQEQQAGSDLENIALANLFAGREVPQ